MSIPNPARAGVVDAIVFQQLLLPGHKPDFMSYTIAGGQSLPAGAVLGRITASGKLVLSVLAAGDGSQVPAYILPEPVNTFAADGVTALDMSLSVYVGGYFNAAALTFGAGQTIALCQEQLRAARIFTNAPLYSGS